MNNFFVEKNFYKRARDLRHEFEENFRDSKNAHQKRFVWDFWYDDDQYHLIRTPAYYYFSSQLYQNFHSYLVQWGRENLGCHDISPPWLSYYVDGCFQKLHSDVPHGPWAFVYSLTPQKREFKGGETLILKPETLNYWPHHKASQNYEQNSFVDIIPSLMNQLVVFDPRFPHGVTEVKGTRDPLKSRLVMHGWFVNPRPYVVGGLSTSQVQKSVEKSLNYVKELLSQIDLLDGTVSIRLNVNARGEVAQHKVLTNTLVSLANKESDIRYFNKEIIKIFKAVKFAACRKPSMITVPLIFK
ncbi:MAG: 2OG-Fe(II) oxygenase [Pseudobdellovibrio sp.]